MDYGLYAYGFVAFCAVYGAIWTAGGQRARLVLSLGVYAYHPNYEPPSRAWRRAQVPIRTHRHVAEFPSWHDYFAQHADDSTPTVLLPVLAPRLVRAEQSADEYGAEHWGELLGAMNTEERSVYSAELVQVYEQTKAVERPFLDGLDAAMERFAAAMAELDGRHAAMFEGVGVNLAKRHGGGDRWSTGQFPLVGSAASA